MTADDALERAIGDWLLRKESDPALLPGEFALELPPAQRSAFLRELEDLAAIDGIATMAASRDLPRRFGDFRVLGELGRGAMGAVFEAEQVSTGQRVALKVLHPHVARDEQSQSRFRREARTAASLAHPGIVPVLGFGETAGCAWLAMARIEGRSLQRLLAAASDPRDVDHATAIATVGDGRRLATALAGAAEALAFAHERGVVHRDVKPANLMCADDGRIVVLDFGLATACEGDGASLTRTGDFFGTPIYMAPEQAKGAENGTAASDVYSLGAVLYECLCGAPAVAPGPLATVLDCIRNRDCVDPRQRRDSVPAGLARIAMQCLEKDPRDRYASAQALADDLRRFAVGEPVQARRSGVFLRSLRRWRRQPRTLLWPAVGALAAVLAVGAALAAAHTAAANRELQRRQDVLRVDELLAAAPERLTMFGGASRRFYARFGLGDALGEDAGRSPEAQAALQLAAALRQRWPADAEVLRLQAMVCLDVGDDEAATGDAIAALLRCADSHRGDRMLAAVWHRQHGRETAARPLHDAAVPATADGSAAEAAEVAFWLGFWHQHEQDHAGAITWFSRALASPALPAERRYWALLHRGWCRTCPDVAQLSAAEDDLLQAAALRPRHATAGLLLAALRCLRAESVDDLRQPAAVVEAVRRDAPTWLQVLTARVLIALAEAGTVQHGPVAFGAEFSPIAVMPVRAEFARAFAELALGLLAEVERRQPGHFEARLHRLAALAMLGQHAAAVAAGEALRADAAPSRRAVVDLQIARVLLAAGSTDAALEAVDRALAVDAQSVPARRLEARIAAHMGDVARQLRALDAAVAVLSASPGGVSVFPDATALLPELQCERVRALRALGREAEAWSLLQTGDFGGVLAGAACPRVALARQALARSFAVADARPAPASMVVDEASPLAFLQHPGRAPTEFDARTRIAFWRGWLPPAALAGLAADADVRRELERRGVGLPADRRQQPIPVLLANALAIAALPGGCDELVGIADDLLRQDPRHGEARYLRALALHLGGREQQAAEFLAATAPAHAADLRCRYLWAVAAAAIADRAQVRRALVAGDRPLSAGDLDAVGAIVPLARRPSASELLSAFE
ncbi:MAG: protein kinase [Planctomycetes bacterium]|nr:protein kinase [Planctomycetota bacterium]